MLSPHSLLSFFSFLDSANNPKLNFWKIFHKNTNTHQYSVCPNCGGVLKCKVKCRMKMSLLTMMQLGFPTAHKLTFLSSPPVTRTRPDLCPRARQLTFAPCATNSSVMIKKTEFYRKCQENRIFSNDMRKPLDSFVKFSTIEISTDD